MKSSVKELISWKIWDDMNNGIRELNVLLSTMEPYLDVYEYVFHTIDGEKITESILAWEPIGFFKEKEGLSIIIRREVAEKNGIAVHGAFRLISLHVHSSLNAIGLTAALSTKLADEGISANVVAAYYHDHIFVPAEKAERALAAIRALQSGENEQG